MFFKRLILLYFYFISAAVFAEAFLLKEAAGAYDRGDFQVAIDHYETYLQSLPEHKRAPYVLFNLGNAYYRAGFLGRSIATYLEARRDLPRDQDLKANLSFALSQTKDRLDPYRRSGFLWLYHFTSNELTILFCCLLCLGFVCLSLFYLSGQLAIFSKLLFLKIGGFFFLFLGAAGYMLILTNNIKKEIWSAVLTSESRVFSGPGDKHNAVLFELHEGAPVIVLKREGDWLQILLSDEKKGWINKDQLSISIVSAEIDRM